MSDLDPDATTDDVLGDRTLDGRRVIVTGSSSGLGEETVRALASRGASVVMAARNVEKNEAAAARIRERHPDAELHPAVLDLADLASVRRFAEAYRSEHDAVDVLVNNAGVMVCPFGHTADGFEMQFGTNHLGHFLLTALLADAVVAGDAARVVTLSSGGHLIADVDLEDPHFERTEYDPWVAYGRSKSANALFARELARRLGESGVLSFSVHPGVVATELSRHLTAELMEEMMQRIAERAAAQESDQSGGGSMQLREPSVGAATQVWAAVGDGLADHNGAYLLDCHVGRGNDVGAHIENDATAAALWSLSEELTGQTFS